MSDLQRTLKDEAEAARVLLANLRDIIGDDEEAAATTVEGETLPATIDGTRVRIAGKGGSVAAKVSTKTAGGGAATASAAGKAPAKSATAPAAAQKLLRPAPTSAQKPVVKPAASADGDWETF